MSQLVGRSHHVESYWECQNDCAKWDMIGSYSVEGSLACSSRMWSRRARRSKRLSPQQEKLRNWTTSQYAIRVREIPTNKVIECWDVVTAL